MLLLLRCRCLYSETSCWQQKPDFTQKQAFIFWIQFCYNKIFCLSQNFLVATLNNSADCQFISYKNYKSFIHLKICWSRLQHNATCCRCREEFSDPGYHGYQKTAFNPQIASHTHTTEAWDNQLLFSSEHTQTYQHVTLQAVTSSMYWLRCHHCAGCDVICRCCLGSGQNWWSRSRCWCPGLPGSCWLKVRKVLGPSSPGPSIYLKKRGKQVRGQRSQQESIQIINNKIFYFNLLWSLIIVLLMLKCWNKSDLIWSIHIHK